MADLKREDILEWVKAAPALELAELVKEMEEVFGVSAAAPVAAAAPAAGEAAVVERRTASTSSSRLPVAPRSRSSRSSASWMAALA